MSEEKGPLRSLPLVAGATGGHTIPPPGDGAAEGSEHPAIDTWIDYAEGRLGEEESSELQEHLLSCRPCIDLVLEIDTFNAVEETPTETSGAVVSLEPRSLEKEATWRSIRSAIEPPIQSAQSSPRVRRWTIPHTLAASFFLALVGLSALNLAQHQELGSLREQMAQERLQPNMAIHDLLPGTHRSRSSGVTFEVPAESSHFTLILNLDHDAEAAQYRVAFVDPEGETTLQVGGLKPVDYTLTLGLSRQLLPEGEYTVELFDVGESTAGREPAETYQLVLVYQDE